MEDSPRPLLRGVFHLYAFYAAVAAGIVLVVLADGLREQLASWVYGVALAAMFGAHHFTEQDGSGEHGSEGEPAGVAHRRRPEPQSQEHRGGDGEPQECEGTHARVLSAISTVLLTPPAAHGHADRAGLRAGPTPRRLRTLCWRP